MRNPQWIKDEQKMKISKWIVAVGLVLMAGVATAQDALAPPPTPGASGEITEAIPPVGTAEAPAAALAPKIVCDEPNFDFGEKSNTEFVEHDYPIRNAGTLSLEIRNVRASCGCTAVKPSQDVVPPGGEASIHARFDLRGRNGFQQKTITVESNDPETPNLILQLKGTALQTLHAEPSSLFFGRVDPNAVRSRTFDIISGKGPIQIVSYRTDNPGLVLTPVAAEPGSDGSQHRFELTLDPSLPEGNINGAAFVKTDLADQPEISIPVAAYVVAPPSAPAAEAVPASAPAPAQ